MKSLLWASCLFVCFIVCDVFVCPSSSIQRRFNCKNLKRPIDTHGTHIQWILLSNRCVTQYDCVCVCRSRQIDRIQPYRRTHQIRIQRRTIVVYRRCSPHVQKTFSLAPKHTAQVWWASKVIKLMSVCANVNVLNNSCASMRSLDLAHSTGPPTHTRPASKQ